MTLVLPNAREIDILTSLLNIALTLRLYSNNVTPSPTSVAGDFTEVAGGGYSSKALTFANWEITGGTPTVALYNAVQSWAFTGATNAPGTIYGYYIIKNSDGSLLCAERFSAGIVPFTPINGSIIKVTPRITCEGGS